MNRVDFIVEAPPKYIKIFDGLFNWRNPMNNSICHLRIYTFGLTKIAIATELPTGENTGMSITNGAEMLWRAVISKYGSCECFETYDNERFDAVDVISRNQAFWSPCVGNMEEVLRGLK